MRRKGDEDRSEDAGRNVRSREEERRRKKDEEKMKMTEDDKSGERNLGKEDRAEGKERKKERGDGRTNVLQCL